MAVLTVAKPAASAAINRSSPLARGLITFDPLLPVASDEAITYRRQLVGSSQFTAKGFTSKGVGADGLKYADGNHWLPPNGYTFMIYGNWPAGGTYIISGYNTAGKEWTFYLSASNVRFFAGHNGTNTDLIIGTSPTNGAPTMMVATWDVTGIAVYQDGVLVNTGANSGVFAAGSAGMYLHGRGDGSGSGLTSTDAYTRAWGAWSRPLSATEVAQLAADPFQLVTRTRRFWSVGVVNPSGTAAITLADVTSSISGTVTPPAVTGTISVTLANVTSSISGTASTDVTGTIANILDNVQPTISGSVANPPTSSQLVLRSTANVVTSAAQLIVPSHQYAYARVTNKTGVTIYVGGADVTTANGFPILNNGSEQFELRMTDALYAIAASGSNTLNVLVQIH